MNQIQYTGTGSSSGTKTCSSTAVTVAASTSYILSGFIDATNVTSGSPQWAVMNAALTTTYGSVSQTAGVKGRVSGSVSIPLGVTSVVIVAATNSCTVSSGNLLVWSAPQLEQNTSSGSATAYKPNAFDDTAGTIAYSAHATGVKSAISSSGAFLNVPFASGAVLNSDGSYSGFSSGGLQTNWALSLGNNQPATISMLFDLPGSGSFTLVIGTTVNGYGIAYNAGSGALTISKWVSSTRTDLYTVGSGLFTTLLNTLMLTVKPGSSANTIELSVNNVICPIQSDSSLTLTSGTWPVTIYDAGANIKLWHFQAYCTKNQYSPLPSQVSSVITSSGTLAAGIVTNSAMAAGAVTASNNTPFGTSITQNSDGSWSGFSSSGSASSEALTIGAGHVITIEGQLKLTSTGNNQAILLGNETNGYGLAWNSITNAVNVMKYVSGTSTNLGTVATIAQDTNIHSFEITITCVSSSSVNIEVAWDNYAPVLKNDTALNLTSGTWPISVYDGTNGTTKYWNFDCDSTQPTYSSLPTIAQTAISSAGALTSTGPTQGASTASGTKTYLIPTYTSTGAAVASTMHAAQGSVTAGGTTTTVTLSGAAAFTSKTSYTVIVVNTTTSAAVPVTITSGTAFSFTSVNTDVYTWFAVGT